MTVKETVLLIGARGYLGSQVLDAVVKKETYTVKALIREGSNADSIEAKGVEVIRGNMMDFESLKKAMEGVDVVINTANGYMTGHPKVDTQGANNVVDAIKAAGTVRRYIYCGIVVSEKATDVEHFYHKKLAEDYMKEKDISFISLRAGCFLDQQQDFLGDGLKRGSSFSLSMWNKSIPIAMIYTPDYAQYYVDAIDLPADVKGAIDVGWSRPVAFEEVVSICASKFEIQSLRCMALPRWFRFGLIYTVGYFSPFFLEMFKMFNFFDGGEYVNNVELQTKYFGEPPTPEDAVGRYCQKLLKQKQEAEHTTSD